MRALASHQCGPGSMSRLGVIDLFHNGGQIKYSSVLMLIASLRRANELMRGIGLINIKTKECKGGRHF